MYIFPGIGMGAILSKARHITDAMVEQAAIALAGSLTDDELSSDLVYPRLTRIRDISAQIAVAVIRAAQKDVSTENWILLGLVSELIMLIFYRTSMKMPCSVTFRTTHSWNMSRQNNGNQLIRTLCLVFKQSSDSFHQLSSCYPKPLYRTIYMPFALNLCDSIKISCHRYFVLDYSLITFNILCV